MSEATNQFDPRHPHEPAIPPTFDDEGRCLVCVPVVERDDAVAEVRRTEQMFDAMISPEFHQRLLDAAERALQRRRDHLSALESGWTPEGLERLASEVAR